ncbi:MAG: bifunctional oligoribonuclease/PAP phosphatase NrnA, partial [Firmicutes bacterium]|nr:bifunctional oligoribonuclease/PAP phosphatase NrnA [Bacillota bacterium]
MFKDISPILKKGEKFIILPHKNADGDCLGSAFALKLMLEHLGKHAVVVPEEDNPLICSLLYGTKQAKMPQFDIVIAVDCGDIFRLGSRAEIFEQCAETINIDHHNTNTRFAKYNCINENAAATGEIIFHLAEYMKIPLTKQIANNLYVAISSDTGCFSFSSTTANTYRIAASLVETGINHAHINEVLFEKKSKPKIMIMRDAFNSFKTYCEGKVAIVSVTKEQILKAGVSEEEAGGLINIPRSLETALVAVSLRESVHDNNVKVGFRSNTV